MPVMEVEEPKNKRERQVKEKSNFYERDMSKLLSIIYHNIYRLHEGRAPVALTKTEPSSQPCWQSERPSKGNFSCLGRSNYNSRCKLCNLSVRPASFERLKLAATQKKVLFSDIKAENQWMDMGLHEQF